MALFLSSFHNKIDRKGRVSVPASFRSVLVGQSFSGIIAYASFVSPCIEACGMERIEKLSRRIEELDPFSEERDAFAMAILGGSVQLPFDSEGRIMLPESLISGASLSETAVFVGKGETFEIWEPTAFAEHAAKARALALQHRGHLRGNTPPSPTGGAA